MAQQHSMDLEGIIAVHKAWNQKLELTLRGQNPEEYDPAIVGSDHLCALGKWLYSEGKEQFAQLAEYHALMESHTTFHKCAADILTAHQKGYFVEAIQLLRQELPNLSQMVQLNLYALDNAITQLIHAR